MYRSLGHLTGLGAADPVEEFLLACLGRRPRSDEVRAGWDILATFRGMFGRDPVAAEIERVCRDLVAYLSQYGRPPSHGEIVAYFQGWVAPVPVPVVPAPTPSPAPAPIPPPPPPAPPVQTFDWTQLAAQALATFGAVYQRPPTAEEQAWIVNAAQEYAAAHPVGPMLSDAAIEAALLQRFGVPITEPPSSGETPGGDPITDFLAGCFGAPPSAGWVNIASYVLDRFRAINSRDPTAAEADEFCYRFKLFENQYSRPPLSSEVDQFFELGGLTEVPVVPSCAPVATGRAQIAVYGDCMECPPGYAYEAITQGSATAPRSEMQCDPPPTPVLSSDMSWRPVDPAACTWQRIRSGGILVPGVYDGQISTIYPQGLSGPRQRKARRLTPGQGIAPGWGGWPSWLPSLVPSPSRQLGAEPGVQTGWCLRISEREPVPLREMSPPRGGDISPSPGLSPFGGTGGGIGGWIAAHPYLAAGGGLGAALVLASTFSKKKARARVP